MCPLLWTLAAGRAARRRGQHCTPGRRGTLADTQPSDPRGACPLPAKGRVPRALSATFERSTGAPRTYAKPGQSCTALREHHRSSKQLRGYQIGRCIGRGQLGPIYMCIDVSRCGNRCWWRFAACGIAPSPRTHSGRFMTMKEIRTDADPGQYTDVRDVSLALTPEQSLAFSRRSG